MFYLTIARGNPRCPHKSQPPGRSDGHHAGEGLEQDDLGERRPPEAAREEDEAVQHEADGGGGGQGFTREGRGPSPPWHPSPEK